MYYRSSTVLLFFFLQIGYTTAIFHRQYPNVDCTGQVFTERIVESNQCTVPRGRDDVSTMFHCAINNQSSLVMVATTYPRSSDCTLVTPIDTEELAEVCVQISDKMSTFIDCSHGSSRCSFDWLIGTMVGLAVIRVTL